EEELIAKFQKEVDKFNEKYGELANAKITTKIHMLPFEKSPNQDMAKVAKSAAKELNMKIKIQPFHAGAETHVYANKLNKSKVKFKPVLVGVANIYSMHSENEKVEIESLKTGAEFVKKIFLDYNKVKF
ncbi:M20/M25/M40 family metallo-hydrolase, partial [bacterium]|nr:M20/M25/M40 family metallo-hydrolase [bacterium]